jgi:NAD(P)H dehydrogenase (quinone)
MLYWASIYLVCKMIISVILAHPDLHSFNHAIAEVANNRLSELGHNVFYHDLYLEKFNPILESTEIPKNGNVPESIGKYCEELSESDGIVIIHPNWWGQPPAILKGWIDRVLRPGVAYEFIEGDKGEGIPIGLLNCKAAIIFNTSNTVTEREIEVFGDPLERIWKDCIFDLCGVKNFYRKMYNIIVTSTPEERKQWLKEVEEIIDKYF